MADIFADLEHLVLRALSREHVEPIFTPCGEWRLETRPRVWHAGYELQVSDRELRLWLQRCPHARMVELSVTRIGTEASGPGARRLVVVYAHGVRATFYSGDHYQTFICTTRDLCRRMTL